MTGPPEPRAGRSWPASPVQERLWFLHRLAPDDPSANLAWTFDIRGPLDCDALAAALDEVVRRHEILRTALPSVDGRPVQRILPPPSGTLRAIDLTSAPAAERLALAAATVRAEGRSPFDLEAGPLVRARLVRLHREHHWLLLVLHHAVADAWSLTILVHELGALYRKPAGYHLADLPLQYADYVAGQTGRMSTTELDMGLASWRRRLTGLRRAQLRPDLPPPRSRAERPGGSHEVHLPPEEVAPFRAACAAERATMYAGLLAVVAAMLYRHTGNPDVLVGTPVADRDHPDLERLIGPFITTLPLRINVSADPTLGQLVRRARDTFLDAHEVRLVPLERIVDQLRYDPDAAQGTVLNVVVVLHNAPPPTLELTGAAVRRIRVEPPPPPFDLVVAATESGDGGLLLRLDHGGDLFTESTMTGLAADVRLLITAAGRAGRRLSELATPAPGVGHQSGPAAESPAGGGEALTQNWAAAVEALTAIWQEVLDIEDVGPDEDFFELGGYSVQAVQIVTRVKEVFEVELTIRTFFENSSVSALSRLLPPPRSRPHPSGPAQPG